MILPIVAYGNDILREKTVPAENTSETRHLVENMIDTLNYIKTGVGLASNQVNSNLSIFLAKLGTETIVHINPTIIKRKMKQSAQEEGCLSVPEIYSGVPDRDDIIEIVSYDINFNKQKFKLRGFQSRIVQHENDHLNGILFIDYLTKEGRENIADKLSKIERGEVKAYYDMIFMSKL